MNYGSISLQKSCINNFRGIFANAFSQLLLEEGILEAPIFCGSRIGFLTMSFGSNMTRRADLNIDPSGRPAFWRKASGCLPQRDFALTWNFAAVSDAVCSRCCLTQTPSIVM